MDFKITILKNGKLLTLLEMNHSIKFNELKTELCKKEQIENYVMTKINNKEYLRNNMEIKEDIKIDLVCYNTTEGYRIHQATLIFLLNRAFAELFSFDNKLVIEHSIGDGVYCETFDGMRLTKEDITKLTEKINVYIKEELAIEKLYLPLDAVLKIFDDNGQKRDDLIKNFEEMDSNKNITVYKCGDYYDYSIRELLTNTNSIKGFNLLYYSPGLIMRFPQKSSVEMDDNFEWKEKLFSTHQQHDKWLNILDLHNVSSLNRRIDDDKEFIDIKKTILIEEALHENKIVEIATTIASKMKDVKLILIAGPSSSGKTTFAKRLDIQLRVEGLSSKVLNLDSYFVSRTETPRKANGEIDYEAIEAINLKMLNSNLMDLMNGKEVELPKYDFKEGISKLSGKKMKLEDNDILILEGIHGLNPQLTESIPFNLKTKIYVSALNNLNIDSHNRIATTDSRKIRRLVRDNNYRKHNATTTLKMWDSVREGEDTHIFPYQENATFMFNSTLTYELGVLKEQATKALLEVTEDEPVYMEAQRLLKILDHFKQINHKLIPLNSILREFYGGNVFDY